MLITNFKLAKYLETNEITMAQCLQIKTKKIKTRHDLIQLDIKSSVVDKIFSDSDEPKDSFMRYSYRSGPM